MPNFNIRTEMSPFNEVNEASKILLSYASDPDTEYRAGPQTVYDEATRRDSLYRSEIDNEGEDQQTQTAFEPFQTTNEYFNATDGKFNANNL